MAVNMEASIKQDSVTARTAPVNRLVRINSLDVLRGLAVLMIFVVNIKMMANGYNHYASRSLWQGEYDQVIGYLHNLLVHGKFVTIFTALFGAGLALLLAREKPVSLFIVLRRLFWLAVFGAAHLIFIREGDILMQYALVGVISIVFVNMRGHALLALGFSFQLMLFIASMVFPVEYDSIPTLWQTGPDMHLEVQRIMLGSWGDQISARIDAVHFYLIDLFIGGRDWCDKLSVMLIGMGLLKTGFLSGALLPKTYLRLAIVGIVSASLMVLFRLIGGVDWPAGETILNALWIFHRFGGALAWSALTFWAVSIGWQANSLAAVGRTAFTVYILQSVIGLLLFSSLGLGLFGQLSLGGLSVITAVTLVLFLVAARLWLSHFRFGPLEWVWRALTYGERQPMLRTK